MRENHNTQSCEYIIIYQDGLYIASTTPEEILHMLKDKYKINIYLQDKYPHDPGGRDIYKYQVKDYLENLYKSMNILTCCIPNYQVIDSYQHFNYLSRKTKLDKLHNEMC